MIRPEDIAGYSPELRELLEFSCFYLAATDGKFTSIEQEWIDAHFGEGAADRFTAHYLNNDWPSTFDRIRQIVRHSLTESEKHLVACEARVCLKNFITADGLEPEEQIRLDGFYQWLEEAGLPKPNVVRPPGLKMSTAPTDAIIPKPEFLFKNNRQTKRAKRVGSTVEPIDTTIPKPKYSFHHIDREDLRKNIRTFKRIMFLEAYVYPICGLIFALQLKQWESYTIFVFALLAYVFPRVFAVMVMCRILKTFGDNGVKEFGALQGIYKIYSYLNHDLLKIFSLVLPVIKLLTLITLLPFAVLLILPVIGSTCMYYAHKKFLNLLCMVDVRETAPSDPPRKTSGKGIFRSRGESNPTQQEDFDYEQKFFKARLSDPPAWVRAAKFREKLLAIKPRIGINGGLAILATLLVLGYYVGFSDWFQVEWKSLVEKHDWRDWSTRDGKYIFYGGEWNEPGNLIFVWGFFPMILSYIYLLGLFEHIVEQQRRKYLLEPSSVEPGRFVKTNKLSEPENETLKGFIRVLVFIFKYVCGAALCFWGGSLLVDQFFTICSLLWILVILGVQIFAVSWLLITLKDIFLDDKSPRS